MDMAHIEVIATAIVSGLIFFSWVAARRSR